MQKLHKLVPDYTIYDIVDSRDLLGFAYNTFVIDIFTLLILQEMIKNPPPLWVIIVGIISISMGICATIIEYKDLDEVEE